MESARCFTAIIKNPTQLNDCTINFTYHSLALCLRIVSIKSNIIQHGCFRHKQMLQRMFNIILQRMFNIIKNSLSKRKKNKIQTIKTYHLRFMILRLKYISSFNFCFESRCSTSGEVFILL